MRLLLVIAATALLSNSGSEAARSRHGLRALDNEEARSSPWSSWAQSKYQVQSNKEQPRDRTRGHTKVPSSKAKYEAYDHGDAEATTACREVRSGPSCDGIFRRFHEEYSMDGDIMLAGLFPVHLGTGCLILEDMGSIQRLEAMAYAVREVNSWPNFMKNFTLGFRIFDTCNSATAALAHTLDVLPHCNNCTHYPICFAECPILVSGIVGPESSSNTLLAAHACNLAVTPIISYFATSVELTDSNVFPTLFATVPADDKQVSAMLALLEHFGWTYFSVVHTDDRYGKDALDYIQLNMDEMCLAAVAQVSSEGDSESYDEVVSNLMQYKDRSDASVVVVFTDGRSANKLFKAVERADVIGQFIWIGSEGWGVSMNDISTMLHVAQGSVTFTPHTEFDPKFDAYFQSLTLNHSKENPWWEEVWRNHFNCSFGVPETDSRSCTQYQHIDVTNGYVPDSTVSLVNDAVYAFAYAINDYVNKTDLHYDAEGKPVIPPWELISYIRDVSFPGTSTRRTMSLGDVTAVYDIKNLQVTESGSYDYVDVGYWSSTEGLHLNEDMIQWPGRKETTPRSYCSEECKSGEIQSLLKISCCWDCEPCPRGFITNGTKCQDCPSFYWPNANFTVCEELELSYLKWNEPVAVVLLTLASIVLLLAILTSFYMIKHRNDRLVKASGRELMTIIMIGVIIQIGLTFTILAKPTDTTCFFIRFLFGLDVTITYSAILVKSNRIYRIFSQGQKSAKPPIWIKKYQQILSAFIIIAFQVIIVAVLCLVYPPKVTSYQPAPDVAELSCYIEEITVLVPLAFNLLIIVPCLYYGWKTRSLPANYNESRYIAFTVCTTLVIWVAFIPVYLTVGTNQTTSSEVHVEILTTVELMSAFITLACFFFPKLYALKFVPTASWHVASMYRKKPNSTLTQCEHCGSIYSNEQDKMRMKSMNSRTSGLVIHRSAQPTELNRYGRRRASSFAEAFTKIKAAKLVATAPAVEVPVATNLRRTSSAPDLTSLQSGDFEERPKFVRSRTDLAAPRVSLPYIDSVSSNSNSSSSSNDSIPKLATSGNSSSFYLFVPTPSPSRRSSSTTMRRSSVVTPVNFSPAEKPAAFSFPSSEAKAKESALTATVKNGHLAAYVPKQLSPPEIRHPNQIPPTPKMDGVDGGGQHVTIAVPETHPGAPDCDEACERTRSSSDAAELKRRQQAQSRRRRSSLAQIANVVSTTAALEPTEAPRPRVLAYTKFRA